MAYTLNRTDGTAVLVVPDATVDFSRTLGYIGKNYANYGEIFNENFLKLQENFANTSSPSGPLEGQIWWDKTNLALKIYQGPVLGWRAIPVQSNLQGTANQVVITASGANITFSLPQNIAVTSTPTFSSLTLSSSSASPLTVNSTAVVTNLNADLLDGNQGTYYLDYNNLTNAPSVGSLAVQDTNNVAITGGTITGITDLALADGGTGASDAATARINLGLGTLSTQNADNVAITGGTITGITDLALADGGTGASNASDARSNLGLGTMSTQNANNVAITGGTLAGVSASTMTITSGTISGITALAVGDGGTGATTAAQARTNLGVDLAITSALSVFYPVGSIYINASVNTNPNALFGFGTWAAFGAGRVMVGFDSADALFDAVEETGGSKNAVLPSHSHSTTVTDPGNFISGSVDSLTQGGGGSVFTNATGVLSLSGSTPTAALSYNPGGGLQPTLNLLAGSHTHTVTVGVQGVSEVNANLQPYITVYMWKRTA